MYELYYQHGKNLFRSTRASRLYKWTAVRFTFPTHTAIYIYYISRSHHQGSPMAGIGFEHKREKFTSAFDEDEPMLLAGGGSGYDGFEKELPPTAKRAEEENNQKQEPTKYITKMMEEKVSTAIPERSPQPPTICEVPEDIAEGNEGAYIPKVVCIGPLFDSKRETASMLRLERYKWRCVRKFIVGRHRAAGTLESAAVWSAEVHAPLLRECFDEMMRLVPRIRASYSSISLSSNKRDTNVFGDDEKLALNMLLDGCFVLHRLLKYARTGNGGGDDHDDWTLLFGRCWVWGTVKRDLLLLSNQVPFFVVRKLFKLLGSNAGEGEDVLVHGGLQFFSSLHPQPLHSAPIACHDVHHLLHLLYLSIDLPPPPPPDDSPESNKQPWHAAAAAVPSSELTRWVPCAKELEEAGVRFRPRKRGAAKSFLDVSFRGGVLEIPPLQLFDYSVPLFRNLIAFEQTYPTTPGRVTAFAIFMDCIVKTSEDVRILHRSGVLVNHMNGERDATALGFFTGLCTEAHTSADRNYLAGVMEEVVRYQRGRWPQWRAALVRDYFKNPWVTTAVVAGAIGLALTALQTFYSVYGYYKPHN
ncbi:UPF0481 protein At3g47200-like isoform X2 [Panicum virgatum]|uniref:Uncharacterized protein n=1 Tax=Panicum virgatum TaxID=38727 RepID=A0A8T0R9T2_PANVG|nr:UPF0481 protein At3g47200-like isoform X2 [Panicum virgatum]KAG2582592.1 hypothetical protein PVAP13_6KG197200 [Panicum virgatum]